MSSAKHVMAHEILRSSKDMMANRMMHVITVVLVTTVVAWAFQKKHKQVIHCTVHYNMSNQTNCG